MKKLFFLIPLFALFVFFYSCQKEKSFEASKNPSTGSLKSDVTGDCLPKSVAGSFEEGVPLVDTSNYISVQVDVSTAGAYLITSDTLNGIWFKAAGVFTNTGLQTVKLGGTGTPFAAGITNFNIFYDTTSCAVAVTVLPSGAGGPAEFSLTSSAGTCMDVAIAGDYVAGIPLTSSNTATIKVFVTTIGTYTVTTIASNGIIFTGTGTFSDTGDQTIVLTASGTPVVAGASTTIPVTVSPTSSCSFTLAVSSSPPVAGDYFPRTINSNWSYEFDDVVSDSALVKVISATKTIGANAFNVFMFTTDAAVYNFTDTLGVYRKQGNDYIEYFDIGGYLGLDPQWVENTFLKDNVGLNSTWYSVELPYSDPGPPVRNFKARLKYVVTQKDAPVTIKSITYPVTIEVSELLEGQEPAVSATWVDLSADGYFKRTYAKDVGLVKLEFVSASDPMNNYKQELRRSSIF